jgi:predicted RNase H-like nuclease (RuvC/YqgF family)
MLQEAGAESSAAQFEADRSRFCELAEQQQLLLQQQQSDYEQRLRSQTKLIEELRNEICSISSSNCNLQDSNSQLKQSLDDALSEVRFKLSSK